MSFPKFRDYLLLEKKYSVHTAKAYIADLDTFASYCENEFQNSDITDANYNDVRSWIVCLVEQGVSNRSVNRKVASLKSYYRFLLKTGQIKINPLAKHKSLKTSRKIEVPFSEKEVNMVLEEIPYERSFEGVRDRLMVEMFYATGIRRAELIGLKLSDVHFANKLIKVLGKRNKERFVPMLSFLETSVKEYLSYREGVATAVSGEYLFLLKSGNKVYETLVYRVINNYFSKASTKVKKSPHILRHTFATHLLNKGADLNTVKELLGHSSLASTQVYTHNSIEQLKAMYEKHPRNK